MAIVMTALRKPELLRAHMADRHLSIRLLAARVACVRGGSASTIAGLASGKRRTCRYEVAREIERALRLDPGELFTIVNTGDAWFLDHTNPADRGLDV